MRSENNKEKVRSYMANYYTSNKEKIYARDKARGGAIALRNKLWKEELRLLVDESKNSPCISCNGKFNSSEVDLFRSGRSESINRMINKFRPKNEILKEIENSIVICFSCFPFIGHSV